nr:zf-CCHC domain-containing protein/UBN2 domain-containing protein [Tanacetum cinerariifolium]
SSFLRISDTDIARKMRQVCCSVVSAVVFRLLFVFFMLEFGVVGATLGAIAGVVIGWSDKTRFMHNAIIGAVSGTALSYKLTKATFDHLNSDDDDELGLAVNLNTKSNRKTTAETTEQHTCLIFLAISVSLIRKKDDKARFETYVKSKDIDLWQVIQNEKFYFEVKDEETKLMNETSYELLKVNEKKQLGKNEEAKMTIYNALPHKEYERVFMCKTTIETFSISNEKNIDSGFTRFNAILTSLKSLDPDYFCKNHVRRFLRALLFKWKPSDCQGESDEDIDEEEPEAFNLLARIFRKFFLKDPDYSRKNHVRRFLRALPLKWKPSDCQGESDEDIDEKESEAFNLLARIFHKFFLKGNRFGCGSCFGNRANRFGKGRDNRFENKGCGSSKQKGACYNCRIESHFTSECRKLKENKAFIGGAWSDNEDDDEHQNDATCLMAIDSKEVVSKPSSSGIDLNIIDLQKENEELLKFNKDFTKTFEKLLKERRALEYKNSKLSSKINDLKIEVKKLVNKEVVEPCKNYDVLTKEVDSLKYNVAKNQYKALNFSKFKSSYIALDDMLSCQKLSQDKLGLGFSKNDKITSASPNKSIVFVKQSQKEIASTSFVKPVVPQTHFANARGHQAPIGRVETTHQGHHSCFYNGLRNTRPRVNPRPLLPIRHMRPSNSYARRPSFQNNHSLRRKFFYNNQRSSYHQPNTFQRRENSYSNKG